MNIWNDREWLVLSSIYADIKHKAFLIPAGKELIYKISENLLGVDDFVSSDELVKTIYTFQEEGIIRVLREIPALWSRRGTPDTWVIEIIQPQFKEFAKEFTKGFARPIFVARLSESNDVNKGFCKFENDCFFMKLNDGTDGSINFTDKRGNKNMLILFEVFFNYWNEFGKINDSWIEVKMTKDEIRKRLTEKGKKDVTDNWIKDTINNIRNIKIKESKLKGYISFDYYDNTAKMYPFKIKKV